MGITVQYQPSFSSVGNASYKAGLGKSNRQERLISEERGFQVANREDNQAYQTQARQESFAQQEKMAAQNFERQKEMAQISAEIQEEVNAKRIFDQEQMRRDAEEYQYTTQQKRDLAEYQESRAKLDKALANNEIEQVEYDYAMGQIEANEMGIKPYPMQKEYPKGQGIHDTWIDSRTGNYMTRQSDGTPKLLDKGDKMSPADYAKVYNTSLETIIKSENKNKFYGTEGHEGEPEYSETTPEQIRRAIANTEAIFDGFFAWKDRQIKASTITSDYNPEEEAAFSEKLELESKVKAVYNDKLAQRSMPPEEYSKFRRLEQKASILLSQNGLSSREKQVLEFILQNPGGGEKVIQMMNKLIDDNGI